MGASIGAAFTKPPAASAVSAPASVKGTDVPAAPGTAPAQDEVTEEGTAPQAGGRRKKRRNVKRRTLRKKQGSRRCK